MVLVYAGLRTALLHRLAFAADRAWIPILPLILTNLNLSLHGFDMPAHIEVGPDFFVPHPVGTVVTAKRIGAGVTLVSAITIGMHKGSDFPALGDDVYVGPAPGFWARSPSATAPRSERTRWCSRTSRPTTWRLACRRRSGRPVRATRKAGKGSHPRPPLP
jgi:hypothetical protein